MALTVTMCLSVSAHESNSETNTEKSSVILKKSPVAKHSIHNGRCNRCGGSGTVACSHCRGNGRKDCFDCNGTGKNPYTRKYQKCTSCNGKGTTKCNFCYGRGTQRCNACRGTGQR